MNNEVAEHKVISIVKWRIRCKPKLDNLHLMIFTAGSDALTYLDSKRVILA